MRLPMMAAAVVLAACSAQSSAQLATAPVLTLAESIRLAQMASPAVRAKEAQLAAAEGLEREAAAPFATNPAVSVEQTRRRATGAAGESANERLIGLSQAFETGGQQERRRQAAAATLEAIRAEIEDARRQARAEATLRFNAVQLAQLRVELEQRALGLFESSAQAVERRRSAGEDTRLDANVALIEAERARNALGAAREQLLNAQGELATVLQLPSAQLPRLAPEETITGSPGTYTLDDLLMSLQALPRTQALAARETAARARLAVEQARRSPDVTLGVHVGREGPAGGRERLTRLSVAVPLPLFNRNPAAIGQALADANQAEIERQVAIRDGEAQVRRLWARLSSQQARVLRIQQSMVPAALNNQQLSVRSRQAGQIGLLDQLVVSRQALDAERELNDALSDFHTTRIELERAAGWPTGGQIQ